MLPAVVRGSIVLRPGVTVSLACTCDTGVMSGDIRSLLTLKGDIVVVVVVLLNCDGHGFASMLLFEYLFEAKPCKEQNIFESENTFSVEKKNKILKT